MLNFQILLCRSKVTVNVTKSKLRYEWKGLLIRNTHVKYESPIFNCQTVMGKVKGFLLQTEEQTERQTDEWANDI